MKDSLLFGKPENILSMEFNSTQKKIASNGKFMLTDPMMPLKFNKLCLTNSSKKQDNLQTHLHLMMNIKNTASTISSQPPLLSHSLEFTDLTNLPLHNLISKSKPSILSDNENSVSTCDV